MRESVSGTYVCNWSIEENGRIKVHIEILFHCTAAVRLPEYETKELLLDAGSYDFAYRPQKDFRKPYHSGTTLRRLSMDDKALEILMAHVPAIAGIARSKDPEMGAKTLRDIKGMTYLPYDPVLLKKAVQEIGELIVTA